jgi:hypothetical protein
MPRLAAFLLAATLGSSAAAAEPRVTFEIIAPPGLPPTAPQEWHRALSSLGISGLRIHSGTGGEAPSIDNEGTVAAPAYKVVGVLSADNVLYLPGGKFALRDSGKLKTWLTNLRDAGSEGVTQARSPSGLLPSELESVLDDLKRPVAFSTQGQSAAAAVRQIAAGLKAPLALDAGASAALAEVTIADELQGLSSGTALAAIARPAGLVLEPRRPRGGKIEYRLGKPTTGGQSWPVGWEPKKRPADLLPLLFDMLNVEIQEISVAEALAAIEGRLKVPFLFDRNALALYEIDPAAVQASVPEKRMSYSLVLRRVLSQAKLRYELRVDDADKPFVWITTIKPAP